MSFCEKFNKYKYKNFNKKYESYSQYGSGYKNEEILFISGHGAIQSPIFLFSVPANIIIVPHTESGSYDEFDIREINVNGRKEIIINAEKNPESIYDYNTLFPDMAISIDTEYPNRKFGYAGVANSRLNSL